MSGLACKICKRKIAGAQEQAKLVYYHQQPDGSLAVSCKFDNRQATGPVVGLAHFKCERFTNKRSQRGGDGVTGRGLGNDMPTAYEIERMTMTADQAAALGLTPEQAASQSTAWLSRRATDLRQASLAGGGLRPEAAQAIIKADALAAGLALSEAEVAARAAALLTEAERAQDPGYKPPAESDWRTQEVFEASELPAPVEPTPIEETSP